MKDRSSQSRSLPAGALANLEDGMKLHQLGQFESAKGIYQLILSANPQECRCTPTAGNTLFTRKKLFRRCKTAENSIKNKSINPKCAQQSGECTAQFKKI